MDNDLLPGMSRWSIKRIIAGLVLVAVVAGLIIAAWNIHARHAAAPSSNHAIGLAHNAPAFTPGPVSPSPHTSSAASTQSLPSSGTAQLSNTGPGSDALIGFIVAAIGGAGLHNLYMRKKHCLKTGSTRAE